jgi:hypothetical protein
MIVGRDRQGDEDGGTPGRGQFGDRRRPCPRDDQVRVAEPRGHVDDIGQEFGGDAKFA